ncbi:enoyl-CoA hydratase [Rhodococcus sp. 14-2496-1d]|uniref:enoyl-CoA hydratase-related protein n=1 Tax=Rhodococcus sp. 14-2496-1d TaxID=2023146 RepID=UPI000B9A67E9|nr:enoyl-CoA hydratase-related protein [Rhodococcus sp. 14-2496-1d]OZF25673.1 enoyl-CoA hydratase [Rhodococcus sp. 14-2496-1d]
MTVSVDYRGEVAVLDVGTDENRFSPNWLESMNSALDVVTEGKPTGLVTVGSGKFFSNGLDVEWMTGHRDRLDWYFDTVESLLARILTLPLPTVAAVNGHAFGAGAMLATAHDFRVMRTDRGYFCFPEVDVKIPFTAGMAALIQAKTTPGTAVAAMTTGRRFSGEEARIAGLIDATADIDALMSAASDMVSPLVGKDAVTLGAIKSTMFAEVATALSKPKAGIDLAL